MYFLTLSRLRSFVGQHNVFRAAGATAPGGKVKLTTAGDLLVGSTARTGVGFILMPFTLMKTISEVRSPPLTFSSRCTGLPSLASVHRYPSHCRSLHLRLRHRYSYPRPSLSSLNPHCPPHPLRLRRSPLSLARRRTDRTSRRAGCWSVYSIL